MSQLTDTFTAIANAIRAVKGYGSSTKFKPSQMAGQISTMYKLDKTLYQAYADTSDRSQSSSSIGGIQRVIYRTVTLISKSELDRIKNNKPTSGSKNLNVIFFFLFTKLEVPNYSGDTHSQYNAGFTNVVPIGLVGRSVTITLYSSYWLVPFLNVSYSLYYDNSGGMPNPMFYTGINVNSSNRVNYTATLPTYY